MLHFQPIPLSRWPSSQLFRIIILVRYARLFLVFFFFNFHFNRLQLCHGLMVISASDQHTFIVVVLIGLVLESFDQNERPSDNAEKTIHAIRLISRKA